MFHVVSKLKENAPKIETVKLQRNVDIKFNELTITRDEVDTQKTTQIVRQKTHRECILDDFSFNDETKAYFERFKGEYLVCPDMRTSQSPGKFGGDKNSKERLVLDIDFKRCDTSLGQQCDADGDINVYIEDMQVETFVV